MKRLNVKSFVIGVALLLSISANAEAGWVYAGNGANGKLYFHTPVVYDAQYAYTIFWLRLPRPYDVRGWQYDARSIRSDIRINCDNRSIKFRTLKAFSNSDLTGHSVRLAYFGPIKPGYTLPYDQQGSPGQRAVNATCR